MRKQAIGGVDNNSSTRNREATNRARDELEAALCEAITRFEHEYMGRRPEKIYVHLVDALLLVRLQGALTAAERELALASPQTGVIPLKQIRSTLVETSRPILEALVEKVAGVQVVSLHHDLSTVTGEEVMILTLLETPELTTSGSAEEAENGDALPLPSLERVADH
jgi:uncharacterized protein YbcI